MLHVTRDASQQNVSAHGSHGSQAALGRLLHHGQLIFDGESLVILREESVFTAEGQNETRWTARASSASCRLADLRDHRLTLVPRVDFGLLSGRTRDLLDEGYTFNPACSEGIS